MYFCSPFLWLQGEECPTTECQFERYSSSNSSTAIATDYLLNISYGGGAAHLFGKFYQDTISLAGLTLPNQYVGSATTNGTLKSLTPDLQPEGLMGLSFGDNIYTSSLNNATFNEPFVFQLVRNNLIPEPIFSYSLGPASVLKDGGELVLGGVNPEKFRGEINYVPVAPFTYQNVTSYGFWQSIAQDLRVTRNEGKESDVLFTNSSSAQTAVMDTGTTVSYMSPNFTAIIYQSVTGLSQPESITASNLWVIDCAYQNSTEFIELSLTHNSDGSAEAKPLKLRAPVSSFVLLDEPNTCVWSILPSNSFKSGMLLGQNFLKNFYVVNNMSDKTMGFAAAADYSSEVIW